MQNQTYSCRVSKPGGSLLNPPNSLIGMFMTASGLRFCRSEVRSEIAEKGRIGTAIGIHSPRPVCPIVHCETVCRMSFSKRTDLRPSKVLLFSIKTSYSFTIEGIQGKPLCRASRGIVLFLGWPDYSSTLEECPSLLIDAVFRSCTIGLLLPLFQVTSFLQRREVPRRN